jgi:predicted peptidase
MKFSLLAFALFHCFHSVSQTISCSVKIEKSELYKYLVYTPGDYSNNSEKKWPLIIYLHGRSACGSNFDKVRRYGLPFFMDRGMQLDAIVAAPQCPEGKNWVADNWFMPFLNDIKDKYNIEAERIYLTGMSLGGFGAFSIAIKYPDVFAAVVPLCGGGQPTIVCPMKDIPTWVFHGDKDELVPLKRSQEMVEALEKCGGNPKFTVLKGQPHDIHRTYNNPELYEWMLKQSKNIIMEDKGELVQNTTDIGSKSNKNVLEKKKIRRVKKKQKNAAKSFIPEESEKIKVEFNP